MSYIDLHTHSTASDGSLSPSALVDLARDTGLAALALTDHDTVAGVDEAMARGQAVGVEVIPGIEISAEYPSGTMHILGYFVDPRHPAMIRALDTLQEARLQRAPKMVARLRELGLDLSLEDVTAASGGGQIGRPHFARVLMAKGYAADWDEAFDRYLGRKAPAYIPKFRFPPDAAIRLIRESGGLAVLAHPSTLELEDEAALHALLSNLTAAGLAGMETHYSEYTPEISAGYLAAAERFGLCPTGGSDFHGNGKASLGRVDGRPGLGVPYRLLEGLRARRKEMA